VIAVNNREKKNFATIARKKTTGVYTVESRKQRREGKTSKTLNGKEKTQRQPTSGMSRVGLMVRPRGAPLNFGTSGKTGQTKREGNQKIPLTESCRTQKKGHHFEPKRIREPGESEEEMSDIRGKGVGFGLVRALSTKLQNGEH